MGGAGRKATIVVLLVVLTTTVFWSAAGNDFVFDDRVYLLADRQIVAG